MSQLIDPAVEGLDAAIERAVAALTDGRLVAFPTETVYGLGADASSATAVARIFQAKGRPTGHPLIVHLPDDEDLAGLHRLGRDVGPVAVALAEAFWPGPLTLIVGRGPEVTPEATGGRDTVGLRVPDHPLTLALLRRFDRGLAGPSANRFGSVSPTTAAHVLDDLGPAVDHVLDGGPCRVGLESTIVDTTGPEPVLLRPGGISAVEIEAVLGRELLDERGGPARASGMMTSHYAPSVPVDLVEADRVEVLLEQASRSGRRIGLVAPFPTPTRDPDRIVDQPTWQLPADAAGYGARLYATLRDADRAGLDQLLVVAPDRGELLDAVVDRLVKAAAPDRLRVD